MAMLTVGHEHGAKIQMHYTDHGEGRPVVLIHGWPLSGRSWEAQELPLVNAGYRVICIDRRGFGKSSQPWEGYDYDTLAADLNVLMEHLDLRDATLVGFSMGGGEVARYLGTYFSERVAKAVFASAIPPYLYHSEDNPDGGLDDATIRAFEEGVTEDRLAFLEDFTHNFFGVEGKLLVSEEQRLYAKSLAAAASPKATLDCVGAFGRTDFRDDLAKISIPTLVIHGDSDAIVPLEVSGKRTAASLGDARLHIIKGAPHGANATHAAEFNDALIGFLNS